MKETFEEFLQRVHMVDEPMVLDDDLPDAFDDWISNTSYELMVAYAEKWHSEQMLVEVKKVLNQLDLNK